MEVNFYHIIENNIYLYTLNYEIINILCWYVCIGMVRSSIDSAASGSPMRQSTDRQFTPAVRQFSAPKTSVKDPSFE